MQRTKMNKVAASDGKPARLAGRALKFQILIVFLFLLPVSRLELLWRFEPYSAAISELGSVATAPSDWTIYAINKEFYRWTLLFSR
jgi:hypothetical protein